MTDLKPNLCLKRLQGRKNLFSRKAREEAAENRFIFLEFPCLEKFLSPMKMCASSPIKTYFMAPIKAVGEELIRTHRIVGCSWCVGNRFNSLINTLSNRLQLNRPVGRLDCFERNFHCIAQLHGASIESSIDRLGKWKAYLTFRSPQIDFNSAIKRRSTFPLISLKACVVGN